MVQPEDDAVEEETYIMITTKTLMTMTAIIQAARPRATASEGQNALEQLESEETPRQWLPLSHLRADQKGIRWNREHRVASGAAKT